MVTLKTKFCEYKNDAFDGIISYFRNETRTKDPYQKGLIAIDASDDISNKANIFTDESDWTNGYWGPYGLNNWIKISFKKNKVALTHYTIKAWNHDYLKSWEFVGSNDNNKWTSIHSGRMNEKPSGNLINITFKTDNSEPFRFIKLINTGYRFANNDERFVIHRLELFGFFFSYNDIKQTLKCKMHSSGNLVIMILVIITK